MTLSNRSRWTTALVSLASLTLPLSGCGEMAEPEPLADDALELRHTANLANTKVSMGALHSCAALTDGTVYCWGNNDYGQLGTGDKTSWPTPVKVTGLNDAIAVAAGGYFSCALLTDGTVRCWGSNIVGEVGDGSGLPEQLSPVAVSGLSGVTAITAGFRHACAALVDGTARCWGYNSNGQLGDGTDYTRTTPVAVSGLSDVVELSALYFHTCARLADGTARCWGNGSSGQMGDGSTNAKNMSPVTVSGLSDVISISAGFDYSCAVLSDGTARCWGDNSNGELGDGGSSPSTTPVTVASLTDLNSIVAGRSHTCALSNNGTASCWGADSYGQLGNDPFYSASLTPVIVTPFFKFAGLSASSWSNCGILGDGRISCWGDNTDGRLGDGSIIDRPMPVFVSGLTSASSGAHIAGGRAHTCAVRPNGLVACWGSNFRAQLGDGTLIPRSSPVAVSGISNIIALSAGSDHSCALASDGQVTCWGANGLGQLGDGTFSAYRTSPGGLFGLGTAKAIASGTQHNCALVSGDTVRCWGNNDHYQLGDGTRTNSPIPVTVSGVSNATAIAAGLAHSCALIDDGTVQCWGGNGSGQLGDGSTLDRSSPVTVSGISDAIAITAGDLHTCALLTNGEVRCWGFNVHGQLGDGSKSNRSTPVTVAGLPPAVGLSSGAHHTFAVLADGTARGWGKNATGQLGDTSFSERVYPVAVASGSGSGLLSGVAALAAAGDHTCAMLGSGMAKCWGRNLDGELGDGTIGTSPVPRTVVSFP